MIWIHNNPDLSLVGIRKIIHHYIEWNNNIIPEPKPLVVQSAVPLPAP